MTEKIEHGNHFLSRWKEISQEHKKRGAVFHADGSVQASFDSLAEGAARRAEALLKAHDRPRVLLMAENSCEWVEFFLGVWLAGGVIVPCESMMEESAVREIEALAGTNLRVRCGTRDSNGMEIQRSPTENPIPDVHADLFKVTSGTSSGRRLIAFTAGQLLADADQLAKGMGISSSDRNLALISFAHSYGLSSLVGLLMARGVSMVPWNDPLPRALGGVLQTSGATVFPGVPAMFRGLAATQARSSSLRLCISAGAPLPSADAKTFLDQCGQKIHSFYGASECGGICYDASGEALRPDGFVGMALPGVHLKPRQTEEGIKLAIRSPAVGSGYFPSRNGDAISAACFHPADILEDCDGGYRIIGRESDFINIAGRKVNPSEIEQVLLTDPRVQEAVVFAVLSDSSRGEVPASCVVGEISEPELKTLCALNLPPWQIPRHWFFVSEIPKNSRGKISRKDLALRFGQ